MDTEPALHKKWNRIPMAGFSSMINAVRLLGGNRRSYQILSNDVTFKRETPVQFDAVYCVMKKQYSNEN